VTRLVVTGARGFVGQHVLACAAGAGIDVASSAVDLLDTEAVRGEVRALRPEGVVHLAARHPARCASLAEAVHANVRMGAALLDALATEAPGAAVVMPGSAAQYGMGGPEPLREDDLVEPVTAHGAVKALVERLALLEPLAPGLRVVATRSFNHVGPGQGADAPVGAWARQIASAERAGGGTLRTGRLDFVRDFLDVRDVAHAYVALARSGARGVVNVCSGVGVSLRHVAERLVSLAAVPIEIREDPDLLRMVDPPTVVGDPSRLRALTGLTPVIPLDVSLRDALDLQRESLSLPSTSSCPQ
jgi:GDP-4-dehydro-6-deoxy-D-mannose reductase